MASFTPNFRGIGELLRSEAMVVEMLRRAEKAKAYAEAIAPKRTGHFAESFSVSVSRSGGFKHDRAAGYLHNSDSAAFQIEVGTSDTPRHHTMAKAMLEGMGD